MSELGNYIELLLREDMPKPAKERIAEMIKEAESNLTSKPIASLINTRPAIQTGPQQAPSTLALMAKHGDVVPPPVMPPIEAPIPVEVIAQTPATAAAMNSRHQAIQESIAGKIDKTTGRPKKW